MSAFVALLGDSLTSGNGATVSTTEALAGKKAVAFYFSAHWCPPCRGFTPKLAEWYKKDLKAKGLEVVFVSSDRDEQAFKEYFGEQPWLALPFADRDRKGELSKKYKVQGIPSLVIVDAEGKTITTDGREAVSEDPTGEDFPWKADTAALFAGAKVVDKSGNAISLKQAAAGKKALALYFSAHWCPPCRGFTPKLAEWYSKDLKSKGLEVVFVSWDKTPEAFKDYYGEQPWLALDYADRKTSTKLGSLFKVDGIPSLTILDPNDFSVINSEGRSAASSDPTGENLPWAPKAVRDVESGPGLLNEVPTIVVFAETTDAAEQARLNEALRPVAEKYIEDAKKEGDSEPKFSFMVAHRPEGIAVRLRQLAGLPSLPPAPHQHPMEAATGNFGCDGCGAQGSPESGRFRCTSGCDFDFCGDCYKKAQEGAKVSAPANLVLLDIPSDGALYKFPVNEAINTKSVEKFLEDFAAGKLERHQLQG